MSLVRFIHGLAVELEPALPRITIQGRRLPVRRTSTGTFECDEAPGVSAPTLQQLAEAVVERSPELINLEVAKQEHVAILKRGVEHWNRWRRHHADVRPILYGATLSSSEEPADFQRADFNNALLVSADLSHAHLEDANFHEAHLGGTILRGAHLQGANFCATDLFEADLTGADLTGANLQGTHLTRTILNGATIVGCTIYGLSAWDLKLADATQRDLIVFYQSALSEGEAADESRFVVDDLQSAQFVYSLLENENVRVAIQAMTSKIVLILGRFLDGGVEVLQRVAKELRGLQYLPIVFTFDQLPTRNRLDTVKTLVGLSRFVVADLSGRSVPAELEANVKAFEMVPWVPILQRGREGYSVFNSRRREILETVEFDDVEELAALVESRIVKPAEAWFLAQPT